MLQMGQKGETGLLPTCPPTSLHPGEKISKERPGTLYSVELRLLRFWTVYTPNYGSWLSCSLPSFWHQVGPCGGNRLAPVLWGRGAIVCTVRQGMEEIPPAVTSKLLMTPSQNPLFLRPPHFCLWVGRTYVLALNTGAR